MEPVYVFGHKHPDTDTVCAAICYSYLKNELGWNTIPRVLGHLNNETKFVLDYFKISYPEYLSDVKIQIKDLNYNRMALIDQNASIEETANFMIDNVVTGLPLVDEDKKVTEYVNLKDITTDYIKGNKFKLNTSYDNILKVLKGREVLRFDDEIIGEVVISENNQKLKLKNDTILILDNNNTVAIGNMINANVKLIITLNNYELDNNEISLLKDKRINVISLSIPLYELTCKLKLCNYVKTIAVNHNPVCVDRLEYITDFINKQQRLGFTNYPVVNTNNECVGMLNIKDLKEYEKKRVILVDHNDLLQSVEGIEEAEILEVVDHHNIGSIGSNSPVALRMMPVGSTSSIVYTLFKENHVKVPKDIAGILLSAIISDTLGLESPTTTKLDVEIANELSKISKVDIKKFSLEMFKAGSSLKGKSANDVILSDYKEFSKHGSKLFISHVVSMDFAEVNFFMEDYVNLLNSLATKQYKYAVMMVTDVSKNGSYLVFSDSMKEILANIYNINDIEQGVFIPNLVSRKKQLLPNILELI